MGMITFPKMQNKSPMSSSMIHAE